MIEPTGSHTSKNAIVWQQTSQYTVQIATEAFKLRATFYIDASCQQGVIKTIINDFMQGSTKNLSQEKMGGFQVKT